MARRILNRRELRAASDDAERRAGEVEDEEKEEEKDAESDEGGNEKKPKKAARPAKTPRPRTPRTPKITRLKLVWGVFNNSNQRVAAYEYQQKAQADAHAAKLTADKKTTHFVQPVKEPFEPKESAPAKSK